MSDSCCVARFGVVSAFDASRRLARVRFVDLDSLVSGWLPVLTSFSLKDQRESLLHVNEHVFCVFLGNGLEAGCVIGAIFDNKNLPAVGDANADVISYADGTRLSYDKNKHELHANLPSGKAIVDAPTVEVNAKSVSVRAQSVAVNASNVKLSAPDIKLTGALNSGGGGFTAEGPQRVINNVESSADVIASGVSLKNHTHICPKCGKPTSGPR